MKKITTVLAATLFSFALLPFTAYAEAAGGEVLSGEIKDRADEDCLIIYDAGEDIPDIRDEQDADASYPVAGDIGMITAVDEPDISELKLEYKMSLEEVISQLPSVLTVRTGDTGTKIRAQWICDGDYNEALGRYPFIPDLSGYTLADDVAIPVITVTFEHETSDGLKGFMPVSIPGREIPFSDDGRDHAGAAFPSKYNLFEAGKLPPVRQQKGGTCWAHATIGAMEADLIHDGKAGADVDLSEMHLAYYFYNNYEDPKHCRTVDVKHTGPDSYLNNGSAPEYAVKRLSNLVGAVSESDAPMSPYPDSFRPDSSYVVSRDKVQIRNTYLINNKDRNGIKSAVMAHGGVAVNYLDEDEYFNSTYSSYYCPDEVPSNHAVMIVGWDDTFPKSNFNSAPAGNGAWLIRNSWGANSYSHFGYFWMSYYDRSLSYRDFPMLAVDATTSTFDHCYAYDEFPFPFGSYGASNRDTVTVTYDVSAHEAVKGIAIDIESADTKVTATAKNKRTGQSVTGSLKTTNAGIYTMEFARPLEVYEASTVEVAMKFTSDEGYTEIGAEFFMSDFEYGAYTFNGVVDRGFYENSRKVDDMDLRVKLYTDDSNATYTKVSKVTVNKTKATLYTGKTLKLTANVSPSNATFKTVKWKTSNKGVATVDGKGNVKAVKKGTAIITVTTVDGKKSATCTITVKPVKVKSVKLNKKTKTLKVGKNFTLKATVSPSNATEKGVKWKSSKKKIATVDKKGKVKALRKGKTTITVTTVDGKKKATCKVTVK